MGRPYAENTRHVRSLRHIGRLTSVAVLVHMVVGCSPLTGIHRAVERGDTGQVADLIRNGADLHTAGEDGWPLLHRAAARGHVEITIALIEAGMSVETRDSEGYSALGRAAEAGRAETCLCLIERGADSESVLRDGRTPLHLAVESKHLRVAQLLLERGARPRALSHGPDTEFPRTLVRVLSGSTFLAAADFYESSGDRVKAAEFLWRAAEEFDQGARVYDTYDLYVEGLKQGYRNRELEAFLGIVGGAALGVAADSASQQGKVFAADGLERASANSLSHARDNLGRSQPVSVGDRLSGFWDSLRLGIVLPDFRRAVRECQSLAVESRERALALEIEDGPS